MSAASAASARDAPCDGRPSASAARSHRPAPLETARHRFGAASLPRAGRASGGPDDGPRVNRRNRSGRGAIASGRSRHRSRAPRRGQLGRARPAGPGRRRGRGRRRVQLFPRRVRRERPRASGAFGPASRACRRLFFWMGPRSGCRRARVGSENKNSGSVFHAVHGTPPFDVGSTEHFGSSNTGGGGGVRGEGKTLRLAYPLPLDLTLRTTLDSASEATPGDAVRRWARSQNPVFFWGSTVSRARAAFLRVSGGDSRLHSARSSSASRASHAARVPSAPAKTVPVH